jgi:DNA repair exonuclease SbcCD ATPase subunit
MKIRKLHIDNYKVFQDFNLDFTNNGKAQSLVAIAGINGSGKTTLLKDFIYSTFHNKTILSNSFIEIEYKENHHNKTQTIDTIFFSDNASFPKSQNI